MSKDQINPSPCIALSNRRALFTFLKVLRTDRTTVKELQDIKGVKIMPNAGWDPDLTLKQSRSILSRGTVWIKSCSEEIPSNVNFLHFDKCPGYVLVEGEVEYWIYVNSMLSLQLYCKSKVILKYFKRTTAVLLWPSLLQASTHLPSSLVLFPSFSFWHSTMLPWATKSECGFSEWERTSGNS